MIRVALIIASAIHRTGLETLLSSDGKIQLVGAVGQLSQSENETAAPDVLVLDQVNLFSDLADEIVGFYNPGAILALSGSREAVQIVSGLGVEAWGILAPDAIPEEIFSALRALAEGLIVAAPDILQPSMAQSIMQPPPTVEPLVESLTEREVEVLDLLARGMPNKQIAHELFISEHTVKFHVSSICGKLGASNRTEAVREGLKRGLVSL